MPALSTLVARRSLAGIAVLAVGCGGDDDDGAATADASATTENMDDGAATTAEEMDEAMGDVLEVAAAEPDLGTFLDALEAAGTMTASTVRVRSPCSPPPTRRSPRTSTSRA